jgi:hypothetical protein
MKKIFLLLTFLGTFGFANATVNIDDFDLLLDNGSHMKLGLGFTSNEDFEYFIHRDVDSTFTNPDVVQPAVVLGPVTNGYIEFQDSGTIPGAFYVYRLTMRGFSGQVMTKMLGVYTSSEAALGVNLLGAILGPTSVRLTVDYLSRGSATTIKFYRVRGDSLVGILTGLNGPGFETATIDVFQFAGTTEEYKAISFNTANPTVYDSAFSQNIITTPAPYATLPVINSMTLVSMSMTDITVNVNWTSDSLAPSIFLALACNGGATPGTPVDAFGYQPGQHDTDITFPNLCGGGGTVSVTAIIDNLFYGPTIHARDTLTETFSTPVLPQTPEQLTPRISNIDQVNVSMLVSVYPFHLQHQYGTIQFEASRSGADTAISSLSYSWPITAADTMRERTFLAIPNSCWTVKTVLVDSNNLRQSWHADCQEVCFGSTTGIDDAPVGVFPGQNQMQDFDIQHDFKTGYAWPISVYDITGKLLLHDRFSSWSSVTSPTGQSGLYERLLEVSQVGNFVIIRTDVDKRTGVVKSKAHIVTE